MKSSFNFIASVYDGVFVVEESVDSRVCVRLCVCPSVCVCIVKRSVDSRVSVRVYVLCVSVCVCVRS